TAINYNVADIDADSKLDTFVGRDVSVAFRHAALNINSAAHSVDNTDELHQDPVACCLDNATAMLGDFRINQFLAMNFEIVKSAFCVGAHEAAVAGNIAGQNRGKSALDAILRHVEPTRSRHWKDQYTILCTSTGE